MANELTLVLEQDIEKLTPKLIAFNNEELLEAVNQKLKSYEGITYTDDQKPEAKKDRAQLNAFATALNNERLRIQKIYLTPMDNFKSKVDEVIARVREVGGEIDKQVKDAELKKQEEKRAEIKAYFNEVIGEYKDLVPIEKIFKSTWLNVSVSLKSVKTEIDGILTSINDSLNAISSLEDCDQDYIRAYYFRTLDLTSALMEYRRMKKEREESARLRQLQEEKAKATVTVEPQVKVTSPETPPQATEQPTVEKVVVKFGVEGTRAEILALKEFLVKNKIKYFAI